MILQHPICVPKNSYDSAEGYRGKKHVLKKTHCPKIATTKQRMAQGLTVPDNTVDLWSWRTTFAKNETIFHKAERQREIKRVLQWSETSHRELNCSPNTYSICSALNWEAIQLSGAKASHKTNEFLT